MSANNASENHGINVYVWVAIVSIPFLICIFHKPIFDGIKRCLRKSRKHNNAAMNLTNKVSGAVYAASHSLGNRAEAKGNIHRIILAAKRDDATGLVQALNTFSQFSSRQPTRSVNPLMPGTPCKSSELCALLSSPPVADNSIDPSRLAAFVEQLQRAHTQEERAVFGGFPS